MPGARAICALGNKQQWRVGWSGGDGSLVLSTADPFAKARLTHAAFSRWAAGLPIGQAAASDHPARPDKPLVVTQKEIITHNDMGVPLSTYMLHNLAHVELNAIDLAWDLRSGKGWGMASSRISLAQPMTRAATFGGTRSSLLSLGSVISLPHVEVGVLMEDGLHDVVFKGCKSCNCVGEGTCS
ncbi:hypothetical protein C2845_PM18G06420 [Panicum miliaceum]|uniref:Uncharacterized protein n=1 Tax=Panicum miliaceum TaxID=4540 RepID=A0A3L6PJI5_PANMI|nr:hypothetical protein C2845_PM18G06420 [Panicum miliaceum]